MKEPQRDRTDPGRGAAEDPVPVPEKGPGKADAEPSMAERLKRAREQQRRQQQQ